MISVDVLILYIMIVDWFNDGRQSIVIVIIGEVNRYTICMYSVSTVIMIATRNYTITKYYHTLTNENKLYSYITS